MAKKWKCVIFDCDGVLVDSLPAANKVILELIKPYGIATDFGKIIHHYNGGSLKACLDKVEEMIDEKLPENFTDEYRKLSYEIFKSELQAIKGARELLEKIDIPVCVASGGPPEKIMLNLETTKLLHYFEQNIFSSYDINSWKPQPDIFLHAADKMGFKPAECIVIEDSMDGVQAAISGGFDVAGLASETDFEKMKKTEAIVIQSMTELLQIIK